MVGNLNGSKKGKAAIDLSSLPSGLKELIELPQGNAEERKLLAAGNPESLPSAPSQQKRQKTPLEAELDALVSARQAIIDALKAKNLAASEARKKIASLLPALAGKGAPHTMRLMEEAERIEFSIATEAYTPKKEKELLKRLRAIRAELSKHKELESARKAVEEERRNLRAIMGEIRSLERELAEARRKCDEKYAQVIAERKSAYEERVRRRKERAKRLEQEKQRRLEELKRRVRQEKKKAYELEIAPYMKKHDDTVSLDEIAEIELKGKKKTGDQGK
jgi:uncharacterized coiled-coil DUF342 family protein